MASIKLTIKGDKLTFDKKAIGKGFENAMTEILGIAEREAKTHYLSKRKPDNPPTSLIISSFGYQIKKASSITTTGILFAGGDLSSYAIYVDEGHSYTNATHFSGYHFMRAGAEKAEELGGEIIIQEVEKAMR